MDTLTALTHRVSVPRLTEPGPTPDQLRQLLAAAIRAPDHGMLRPWRFIVLQGEQRERLADVMEWRLLKRQPDADPNARENLRGKALRAPTVIVAVAEITENHKIPAWEQVLAVGAAVQNIMVAAHALGLGAMWRTGDLANDPDVKPRLGFADKDQVVGFVYLGTPAVEPKSLPDETPDQFLRELPRG
ncbi:nitroreductase family protein [Alloalcanivorax gelatiniphagus]|uniref:Putative NAD(P)H nitroreductase n=1 Tax=Alloalcanivorax gelatiniphagus TaxID=1194167 RepID=A0ABY2XL33_9GAMM|nr:nitroreductase [Alloalcanivorax gelatiniphagus]TMW12844.1 nitroreductase [Alloalcanivorax gelatiniphagus]|tara:strand:- start:1039 stop:1602 length:564 start_codon:yes stop_codon:yes gene_type:complete